MALSPLQRAKRAFVALLKTLALTNKVVLGITRESTDAEVSSAYRTLSRKVHPDRGGSTDDQTRLNVAHDLWKEEQRKAPGSGRPPRGTTAQSSELAVERVNSNAYRINSLGVLLTYQGFKDVSQWFRFVAFFFEPKTTGNMNANTGALHAARLDEPRLVLHNKSHGFVRVEVHRGSRPRRTSMSFT